MRIWDRARRTRPCRAHARRRPRLELLEDRLAPATLTVTTTADDLTPGDGTVSLREAITAINAGNNLGDADIVNTGAAFGTGDTIHFNIPGSAPFQINVGGTGLGALPTLVKPVVIDGASQTGFAGKPIVVVNGAAAGANANGFNIELGTGAFTSGVTINALVINGFSANGVLVGPDNLSGAGGVANTVTNNYIGTNAAGTTAVPNALNGVFVNGVDSNNTGTAASDNLIAGNVISGNGNDGVLIQANVNGIATGNLVSGNFIGTTAAGTAAMPNGQVGSTAENGNSGVEIVGASGNLVGGTNVSGDSVTGALPPALTATAGAGNVVSGNAVDGVHIIGTLTDPAQNNGVAANFVGVDASGNVALGNARFGIEVSGGLTTVVGGEAANDRNVVGANAAGIELDNGAQNNFVVANFSGVGANGVAQVGNKLHGIVLRSNDAAAPPLGPGQPNEPGVQNNQIGGTVPGDGNTVAFNGTAGIAVFGNPVSTSGQPNVGNSILGNSVFLNGRSGGATPLLGIDLTNTFPFPKDDGPTPNDSKGHGAANDPNNFQNFPVLTSVTLPTGGGTTIAGTFTESDLPNAMVRLEFFANNPDPLGLPAEGQTFLGSVDVTTNGGGTASFSLTVPTTLTAAQSITATATSQAGNTSEFSAPFGPPSTITVLSGAPQSAAVNTAFASPLQAVVRDQFGNPVPGAVVTFTAPSSGAGGTFAGGALTAMATTDAGGTAVAPTFTANTTAGQFVVSASVNGASTPASFNLTNTAGAPASITVVSGGGQSALINTAFAAPLVALVTDAFGNPVPGASVTFAAPSSGAGASFAPGATVTTNAAGQAAVAPPANGTGGTYVVTASVAGVSTPANFTLTNTTTPPPPVRVNTVGVFDPTTGNWYLRSANSAGLPDAGQFRYGFAGTLPVVGDWDGRGADGIGVFDPSNARWYLRFTASAGAPDAGTFLYGAAGWESVTGDWHNSGHTGIGAYDPVSATWYLHNDPDAGPPDAGQFAYGVAGGIPVVGDWTGTGHLGIGVFDPTTATWYLRSSLTAGAPDVGVFRFGGIGWRPVVADWTGAGHTGIGVFDPSTATFYLRTEPNAGLPDAGQFAFGGHGFLPVAGFFPHPVQPLLAAGGEGPGGAPLSAGQLQSAVTGALARLGAAGIDPGLLQSLASASYGLANLPPGVLGQADAAGRRVLLSADGAGHGWFADPTPGHDEEFAPGAPGSPLVALPGSPAAGKADLLTAVLHEMGHLAGNPDGGTGLMADALAAGARNLGALDQVFAGGGGTGLAGL